MTITTCQENDLWILRLEGKLDHEGAKVFQETVDAKIAEGARRILVDFGGTSFVASMGIRALIAPTQKLAQMGGQLAICALSPAVAKLFALAGLQQIFSTYSTIEEAKQAWSST